MADLRALAKYMRAIGLEAKCQDHAAYTEIYNAGSKISDELFEMMSKIIPKQQVIATGEKGKISIIHSGMSMDLYEIYCLEGDLFEDIKRYSTMTDCARTVYGLLTHGEFDINIPRQFDVFSDFISEQSGCPQDVEMPEDLES